MFISKSKNTHLINSRQAVQNAEHELGVALRVVRQADPECVDHHLVEALGEQWLRQLPQVVLQHA